MPFQARPLPPPRSTAMPSRSSTSSRLIAPVPSVLSVPVVIAAFLLPQRRQRPPHAVLRADFDLRVGDPALLVDHEVAADDAHILLAHEGVFAPHAVRLGDMVVGVHQQCERQVIFGLETAVRLLIIGTHAKPHRVLLLDDWIVIPESARLRRASRRVILRVEEKYYALAAKV